MSPSSSAVLHSEVCDLFGCDYPVVLAGMVRESPDLIRREVEVVRQGTSWPFGVNIIPAATEPAMIWSIR